MTENVTPDLLTIAEYLKMNVSTLRAVDAGFEAAAGADRNRTSPAALVLPSSAGYGPNKLDGAVRQERTHVFSVVLFFSGAGANGKAALLKFEAVKNGVLDALIGWRHPLAHSRVMAVAERLLKFDAERPLVIYEMRFSHRSHVQKLTAS